MKQTPANTNGMGNVSKEQGLAQVAPNPSLASMVGAAPAPAPQAGQVRNRAFAMNNMQYANAAPRPLRPGPNGAPGITGVDPNAGKGYVPPQGGAAVPRPGTSILPQATLAQLLHPQKTAMAAQPGVQPQYGGPAPAASSGAMKVAPGQEAAAAGAMKHDPDAPSQDARGEYNRGQQYGVIADRSADAGDDDRSGYWNMDPRNLAQAGVDAVTGQDGGGGTFQGNALRQIIDTLGGDLGAASGDMSRDDLASMREDYSGVYDRMGKMENAAEGAYGSSARADAEKAARDELYSGVNANQDRAMRMQQAMGSRGGSINSGTQTGIQNAAQQAIASGERGLAQDKFGRDLAANEAYQNALGGITDRDAALTGENRTSRKDLLSMIFEGLNPLSALIPG